MTTLERLTKQRDAYAANLQRAIIQAEQLKGAIEALNVQIAEESKPPPNRAERRREKKVKTAVPSQANGDVRHERDPA